MAIAANFGMEIHCRGGGMRKLVRRPVARFALHVAHLRHPDRVAGIEIIVKSAVGQRHIPAGGMAGQANGILLLGGCQAIISRGVLAGRPELELVGRSAEIGMAMLTMRKTGAINAAVLWLG